MVARVSAFVDRVAGTEGDVAGVGAAGLDAVVHGDGACAAHVRAGVGALVEEVLAELAGPQAAAVPARYAPACTCVARCAPLRAVATDTLRALLAAGRALDVDALCADATRPVLAAAGAWLRAGPAVLLRLLGSSDDEVDAHAQALCRAVTRRRVRDVFEMVKAYPESVPALRDLRRGLVATGLWRALERQLRRDVAQRLLTSATTTYVLLVTFIKTVKAVRVLDPTGLVLDAVAAPIRAYLAQRRDTVQCVVDALVRAGSRTTTTTTTTTTGTSSTTGTTRGGDDITDAFRAEQAAVVHENPLRWTPAPTTPAPVAAAHDERASLFGSARDADILPMLESLWGSHERFTAQYARALADVLLDKDDWDVRAEAGQLAALQTRFGAAALQACDVMLHDIAASAAAAERVDAQFPTSPADVTITTIVSHHYWPEDVVQQRADGFEGGAEEEDDDDNDGSGQQGDAATAGSGAQRRAADFYPRTVWQALQSYAQHYAAAHPHRRLRYLPTLGYAIVEVAAPGSSEAVPLRVSPVEAAVVARFAQQGTWSVGALAAQLHVSKSSVTKALVFWASKGFIAATDSECTQYTVVVPHPSAPAQDTAVGGASSTTAAAATALYAPAPGTEEEEEDAAVVVDENLRLAILGEIESNEGGRILFSELVSGVQCVEDVSAQTVRSAVAALLREGAIVKQGDYFQLA